MLPSNGFAYNFNGPALNGYGQLSINHPTGAHLNSSLDLIENGPAEHATHLIDGGMQHSQLYELHPHQPPPNAVGGPGNYSQPSNLESANLESANLDLQIGRSLFKLKSFLNPPKKPMNGGASMQGMFPAGQELTPPSPQLLSSPTENGNKTCSTLIKSLLIY